MKMRVLFILTITSALSLASCASDTVSRITEGETKEAGASHSAAVTKEDDTTEVIFDADNPVHAVSLLDISKTSHTVFLAVQKGETGCDFYAFRRVGDGMALEFSCEGYLGRCGVIDADEKREGDGCTPDGVYKMGECFGIKDAPCEVLAGYIKVTQDDYWDSDPLSDTYNRLVKGSSKSDEWLASGKYEHLINYSGSYDYAAMINYNVDPAVPHRGSAIFLHCMKAGSSSSAGCVSIPEEYMKQALSFIDDNSYIVIVKSTADLSNYISK